MEVKDVKKVAKSAAREVSKRSPGILTGLGVVGMITTSVLAVRATPKALQLIEEAKQNKKEEPLTKIEIVKVTWKQYIPAVLMGTASAACIIGANTVNARRHAALYSAYKLSETALTEYQDKVKEVVSEKKVKEIKQKIAEDKVDKAVLNESDATNRKVIVSNDGDSWFIDPYSNTTFRSTTAKIDAAINRVNKTMLTEMFVSLTDLYDELGLDHTRDSDYIGWCIDDGIIESDFNDAVVKNDQAYVVMDFLKRPSYNYDNKSKLYG